MSFLAWAIGMAAACGVSADYTEVVSVAAGSLRGVKSSSGYYSYLGIPYAIVEKRFQAAIPVTSWNGVLDAIDGDVQCNQKNPLSTTSYTIWPFSAQAMPEVVGTEDCLHINVYTSTAPNETPNKLKSVMVFIFGGGFATGSGATALYGPEFLVEKDVVLVSINYRLDILGFMCLGIKEAPGNAGLKDQVLALKWVQKNIKVFGGDPDQVTIFGQNSGAASVGLHLMSPMSKGLFSKVIMQSGVPLDMWAMSYDPLKAASQLGNLIGYNTTDPYELYNIFMNKSVKELQVLEIPTGTGELFPQHLMFKPCVENTIEGVEPFITDLPYNIITNNSYNKVQVLMGYCSHEYYPFALTFETEATLRAVNNNLRNTFPNDLTFLSEVEANAAADKARELYFGTAAVNSTNIVDYVSDLDCVYGVLATIELFVKNSGQSVYAYEFNYNGTRSVTKNVFGFRDFPGAGHFDDIYYLFNPVFLSTSTATDQDLAIIGNMTTMWTNFAKYGNPTPADWPSLTTWEPVDARDPEVYVIDKQYSTKKMWNERQLFWNTTYSHYRTKSAQAWNTTYGHNRSRSVYVKGRDRERSF